MRIRGATTELEEAGLETEGMAKSTAELRKEIEALSGVDIMLDDNTFKSTYQIMDELAQKWQNLTDIQQASITELIAGKRQGNIISSLMNNFDVARDALETSLDAEGSAMEEHAKWMESIEAKIRRLTASWQSLSQTVVNSDVVKVGIDFLTGVVNLLDFIIDKFGTLIALFAGFSITKTIKDLGGLSKIDNLGTLIKLSFTTAGKSIKNTGTLIGGFFKTVSAGTGIVGKLGAAFKGLWSIIASNPVVAVIAGIAVAGKIISDIIVTAEEAEEAMNKSFEEYDEAKQKVDDLNSELDTTKSRIEELESKDGLTFVEEAELKKLRESVKLLEMEAKLADKDAIQKAKEAADDTVETYNKKYGKYDKVDSKNVDTLVENNRFKGWASGNENELVAYAADYVLKKENVDKAYEEVKEILNKDYDSLTKEQKWQIEDYNEKNESLDTLKDDLFDYVEDLVDLRKKIEVVPENIRGDEQKETLSRLTDEIEFLWNLLDPAEWNQIQFNNIFSENEDFAKQKQELIDMAAANKSVGITANDVTSKYGDLAAAIKDAGFEVQDLVNNVNSEAGVGLEKTLQEKITAIVQAFVKSTKYTDEQGKSFGDWLSTLGEGEKEIVYKISLKYDTSQWSGADWIDAFNNFSDFTKEQQEKVKESFQDNSIVEWFNSLSKSQKELVYKIGVESDDTTLWTLTRWQNELQYLIDTGTTATASMETFYDVMNNSEEGNFSEKINSYTSTMDSLNEALEKITAGTLTNDDKLALAMDFPELAYAINDTNLLQQAIQNLINTTNEGISDEFAAQIEAVGGEETAAGKALLALQNMMNSAVSSDFDIEKEIDRFNNLYTAISESASATGLSAESIANLKTMYADLDGYDPSKLFERTENGIHLNEEALKALQKEYEDVIATDFQNELQGLQKEYEDAKDELEGLEAGTEEYDQTLNKMKGINDQIQDVQNLMSQYDGLTSAYNKWINAQSADKERDSYENIGSQYDEMKALVEQGWFGDEELNAYLDLLLGVGDGAESAAERFARLGKTIDGTNHSLLDYWKYDEDDNLVTDGLFDFLDDVAKFNSEYAGVGEDGKYWFDFSGSNIDEIAKKFGTTTEMIQLFERALIDTGAVVDMGIDYDPDVSEYSEQLKEYEEKSEKAKESLKEYTAEVVKANGQSVDLEGILNYDIASMDIEAINGKIADLTNIVKTLDTTTEEGAASAALLNGEIANLNNAKTAKITLSISAAIEGGSTVEELLGMDNDKLAATLNIDTSVDTTDIDTARQQLESLQTTAADTSVTVKIDETQFAALTATDKTMNITVDVTGDEKLTTLQTVIGELVDTTIKILVDPTEASKNIENVLTQLNSLPDDAKAKLGLDDTEFQTALANINASVTAGVEPNKEDLDVVYTTISTITPEMIANVSVDDKEVQDFKSDNHDIYPTAQWNNDTKEVDRFLETNLTKTGTVTWVTNGVEEVQVGFTPPKKAEVNGTAYARGNWGTKDSGVALGGELGQELVVRNGRFFTIGDDSAEFFKYQKDDIIFNADQTKQIFEKGKITSGKKRGKAHASGSAFALGTAKFAVQVYDDKGGGGSRRTNSGSNTKSLGSNSSSTNKKSSSKSSSSKKDFEETFDWIEVAIDRVERAISNLDLKASSVYRSWSSRNKNLKKEISKVGEEISIQQQGYDRYIQQANSVGLSESWAKLVRDGEIDIDTITDEKLAEKIGSYTEWYNKALDCKYAIDELKETQSELYQQAFNNIVAQYDGFLSVIEHERNMLDGYISQSEASGYIVSQKYYQALINVEKANIEKLEEEKDALLTSLEEAVNSDTIKPDSEAWFEMVGQIDEVTRAIQEANTSLIEFNNSIRDIEWQLFDLLQENISQVAQEADFLIDLLSSDKLYDDRGQLTDEGMSTMGLHGQNYNTYMYQADKYAQEMLEINKELAEDPYNQTLIERRKELLELQQESILAAEDEKQAIVDMVKEGIELELDALQELIDSYAEALDSQKDLYDYQRKIKEQTEEIASLEKQMSAYAGDDSEETRQKIQQIKVSLEEAKENLEESEYDKYVSDQKQLLDELYLEYETILNARLDNIDALIQDMIIEINTSASTINSTLTLKADEVGYNLSETMKSTWDTSTGNITTVLTTYGQGIQDGILNASTTLNTALSALSVNIQNMMTELNKNASSNVQYSTTSSAAYSSQAQSNTYDSSTAINASTSASSSGSSKSSSSSGSKKSSSQKSSSKESSSKNDDVDVTTGADKSSSSNIFDYKKDSYPKSQLNTSTSIVDRLKYSNYDSSFSARSDYYNEMGFSGTYTGSAKQNSQMVAWMKKNGYRTGVYKLSKDELAWTQEGRDLEAIIRPSDGAILTPLAKNDSVLKASATANIFDFANNPSEFIRNNLNIEGSISNVPAQTVGGNTYHNEFGIQIELPNVQNYEQFKYAMQHDPKFEKMVRAMTVDKMFGGSSLKKYNC